MLERALAAVASEVDRKELWLGTPVREFKGSFADARAQLPVFARVPFSVEAPAEGPRAANPTFDAVVRLPLTHSEAAVPVGIVSKSYQLVQHQDVMKLVEVALDDARIDLGRVSVTLRLTERGERMALQVVMPDEQAFRYTVEPDDSMGLQLFCLNSVEGSTRFGAVLGWLRFVCSNGLVLGTALTRLRRLHNPDLRMDDVGLLLQRSLRLASDQRAAFERWSRTELSDSALQKWVDNTVRRVLGVRAAVRALHIVRHGHDVTLADPFERAKPSQRRVIQATRVPGALRTQTAFAAAQALSWLAGQRREIPEQLTWLTKVPPLVNKVASMN